MFEHQLQQFRHDDLVRRAEQERQAREAVRLRRAARREAAAGGAGPESHTRRHRRDRFIRAA
ncbi:hypothetical protein [Streptomyces griseomycini]|uniref:Uncharacterized protein n=1 Tax=Streptomyces griseomycini TaxID=66895 RepID=A0A7W7PX75_9ACTN|nr:hypothetical protein [Streptomyces griseomycini]MBB4902905.1 hypothetical protein [Streptomyces griseomycini]GGQ31403.1 hypothetical protein GCM10010266_63200 [Streptomyces griseomycini]GGR47964.1 hypothetical protein GCM10015536_62140 [Streptomyces griseomycini]